MKRKTNAYIKMKIAFLWFVALALPGAAAARSIALNLCGHTNSTMSVRTQAAVTPSPDGLLRSFNLNAGVAEVGEIAVGDVLTLSLFDDLTLTLTVKEKMSSLLSADTFIADVDGSDTMKTAVVLRTSDGLTVDIQDFRAKRVYKVISTSSGVKVREFEASAGTNGCDALTPPVRQRSTDATPPVSASVTYESSESDGYVDILIAYDKNAVAWVDEECGGITNFAEVTVQKMNTVLANTDLDESFRFRLAGVMGVSVSTTDLNTALDAATYADDGWEEVSAKRDEVGADLVSILVDTGSAYGVTGLGWSLSDEDFEWFSNYAYNACSVRSVAVAHTMTHEIGHNMGCGHSDEQESSPGPQLYDCSAGYYFTANGENYCTVMTYEHEGPGGTTVPYFSSPDHMYEGVAVGDADHDNTATLLRTYAAVSRFRDAVLEDSGIGSSQMTNLMWVTRKQDAVTLAKATGRRILLVSGREGCVNTSFLKTVVCESVGIKSRLSDFVLWFNDIDELQSEVWDYTSGLSEFMLPLVCVIDPAKTSSYISRSTDYVTVESFGLFLDNLPDWEPGDSSGSEVEYHIISFDENGGSIEADESARLVVSGTMIGDLPVPIRLGFAFDGWYTEVDGGDKIVTTTVINGDCVFYAHWTPVIGEPEWVISGTVLMAVNLNGARDVVIPDGITKIGESVFDTDFNSEMINLLSVTIPSSVREIGDYAFYGCVNLAEIIWEGGIDSVDFGVGVFTWTQYAEEAETTLLINSDGVLAGVIGACPETLVIPDTVTAIGQSALDSDYNNTKYLSSLTVPSSVREIGDYAFYGCSYLEDIYWDGGIDSIDFGVGVFYDVPYVFNAPFTLLINSDGVLAGVLGVVPSRVVIPDGVTAIGEYAFFFEATYVEELISLTVPSSVREIGDYAFYGCSSLLHVRLPSHLRNKLDSTVFKSCHDSMMIDYYEDDILPHVLAIVPHWYEDMGSVAGSKTAKIGTKVTLRATARRGYVFAGWYEDEEYETPCDSSVVDYRSPSYTYVMGEEDVALYARFEFLESDAILNLSIDNVGILPDDMPINSFTVNGVTNMPISIDSYSLPKIAVKGLPAGMKFTAKGIYRKGSVTEIETPANSIYGAPTKPGVYKVTVSLTNTSIKKAVINEFEIVVPNLVDDEIPVADQYGPFVPGVSYVLTIPDVEGCKVTGLPAGMKWTAKDVVDRKTQSVIPACSVYGAPTKPGKYTVYFTKTIDRVKHTATSTFVVGPFPVVNVGVIGTGTGKVTGAGAFAANKKVTLKAIADTRDDAKKGTKKSVFAGWYLDEAGTVPVESSIDYRTVSLPYVMTAADETTLYAMFVAQEEDSDIGLAINGNEITADAADNNFVADGRTILPFELQSVSIPKATVKGLPAGMKFTAKALTVKATKTEPAYDVPANVIYGTPTKPGVYKVTVSLTNTSVKKALVREFMIEVPNFTAANGYFVDALDNGVGQKRVLTVGVSNIADYLPNLELNKDVKLAVTGLPAGLKYDVKSGKITGVATRAGMYTVTLTITDGREKYVSTFVIEVESLPDWAVGTFNGGGEEGQVTLTVAKTGKMSGKYLSSGLTWTLSAASFDSCDDSGDVYRATLIGKSGKLVMTNEVGIAQDHMGGFIESMSYIAYQNNWKLEPWKTIGKPFTKAAALGYEDTASVNGEEVSGVISLKFAATGTVKAAGSFVVGVNERTGMEVLYKASGSAVLAPQTQPDENGAFEGVLFVYFPPKADKFDGYVRYLAVRWDGEAWSVIE